MSRVCVCVAFVALLAALPVQARLETFDETPSGSSLTPQDAPDEASSSEGDKGGDLPGGVGVPLQGLLGQYNGQLQDLPQAVLTTIYVIKCVPGFPAEYVTGAERLFKLLNLPFDGPAVDCEALPLPAAAKAKLREGAALPQPTQEDIWTAIAKGERGARRFVPILTRLRLARARSLALVETESKLEAAEAVQNPTIKTAHKWPNNLIKYYFDPATPATPEDGQAQLLFVWAAMYISSNTHVNVVPIAKTATVMKIRVLTGVDKCLSDVGMGSSPKFEQDMSASHKCAFIGLVHELMHAIGFGHTMARADRNLYVKVFDDNIEPGLNYAFNIRTEPIYDAEAEKKFKYDYDSIMHYPTHAFGKPDPKDPKKKLQTIKAREEADPESWKSKKKDPPIGNPANMGGALGQYSPQDIAMINALYPENGGTGPEPNASDQSQGDLDNCLDVSLDVFPCVVVNKCDLTIQMDLIDHELATGPPVRLKDQVANRKSSKLLNIASCSAVKIHWSFDKERLTGIMKKGKFRSIETERFKRELRFLNARPIKGPPKDKPQTSMDAQSQVNLKEIQARIEEMAHANDIHGKTRPEDDKRLRVRVQITGHASKTGTAPDNMELSRRRAQMVKDELATLPGVSDDMYKFAHEAATPPHTGCQEMQTGIRACGDLLASADHVESRKVEVIVWEEQ